MVLKAAQPPFCACDGSRPHVPQYSAHASILPGCVSSPGLLTRKINGSTCLTDCVAYFFLSSSEFSQPGCSLRVIHQPHQPISSFSFAAAVFQNDTPCAECCYCAFFDAQDKPKTKTVTAVVGRGGVLINALLLLLIVVS